MEVFGKIPRCAGVFSVLAQGEHVLIMAEHYEGIFDLKRVEFYELDGVYLPDMKVGDKLGGFSINQDTVTRLQVLHGRVEDVSQPDLRYTLEEVSVVVPKPSSQVTVNFNSVSDWLLAEIGYLASVSNRRELPGDVEASIKNPPKIWRLNVHGGWTASFISRDEPQVVIYDNHYYIFIAFWDETLEVLRHPARKLDVSQDD